MTPQQAQPPRSIKMSRPDQVISSQILKADALTKTDKCFWKLDTFEIQTSGISSSQHVMIWIQHASLSLSSSVANVFQDLVISWHPDAKWSKVKV